MKYIKISLIILFLLIFVFIDKLNENKFQVLDVYDYKTFSIDLNKNFQKDKDELIELSNIELPEYLPETDKFLLKYLLNKEAKHLLQNKFVTLTEDKQDILIEEESYKKKLSSTNLIINAENSNQNEFKTKLESLHKENYVLLNTKSKRYHKLTCESGLQSKNYKLIPFKLVTEDMQPCKSCHVESTERISQAKIPQTTLEAYSNKEITIFPIGLNDISTPIDTCRTSACKTLLKEINSAKKEILFAIYGIHNQKDIFNALIDAQARGVSIRWVSDYSTSETNYYPDTEKLAKYITNVKFDKADSDKFSNQLMHNKFFIFDSKKVFTGSPNITYTDLTGFNSNFAILINNEEIANIYKQEFEQMYSGKFHEDKEKIGKKPILFDDGTQISIYFSPKDKIIISTLIPIINSAQKEINISIFYITHKKLLSALINAHKRNVKIKVINDATNASNKYSIHNELRKAGIEVKTENYAGKMHSKMLTIDGIYTIIGSMNLTSSGENKNDENVVLIKNPDITRQANKYFETIWNQIDNKYLTKDPLAESNESIYSCTDGIDNDFDGKIDNKDNGCFKK